MVHKTAVERELNGKMHCLYCRLEAFRVGFEWYCQCQAKDGGYMSFEEWLQYGIDNHYCSNQFCSTHDVAPMHETEEDEWEDGGDPCQHVVRLGSIEDWVV